MKLISLLGFILLPMIVFAAGGKGDGVPSIVMYQAINVVVVFAILHFYARPPLVEMFKTRRAEFEASMAKAKEAKVRAEKDFEDIKQRLDKIKAEESSSLETAKKEAEQLGQNIVAKAEEAAKMISEEASKSATHEIEKAKVTLRTEVVQLAMETARKALDEQLKPEDQARLQDEFSSRLQVVE